MGILEIVFNSRKFDLNDDVLMGFDNYFDKKSKDYNSFCLDEEDINPLQNFVAGAIISAIGMLVGSLWNKKRHNQKNN